jgi:hypothetical protein
MGTWDRAWLVVLAWFGVVVAIFSLAQNWAMVSFALIFGVGFGAIAWVIRSKIRPAFERLGLANFGGFAILAVAISSGEEVLCWALGNRIANPVLWKDLVLVNGIWLVWYASWYFILSKKFAYKEKEALLLAAGTGILYEYVSSSAIWTNPAGILLGAPLAVVIYAALFILPMQLVDFMGKDEKPLKYAASPFLPYILSFAVALPLVLLFSVV